MLFDVVLIVEQKPHKIFLAWLWLLLPAGLIGLVTLKARAYRATQVMPPIGRGNLGVDQTLYLMQSDAGFVKPHPGYQLERPNRRSPEPIPHPVKIPPSPCKECGEMDVRMTDWGFCVPCVTSGLAIAPEGVPEEVPEEMVEEVTEDATAG